MPPVRMVLITHGNKLSLLFDFQLTAQSFAKYGCGRTNKLNPH